MDIRADTVLDKSRLGPVHGDPDQPLDRYPLSYADRHRYSHEYSADLYESARMDGANAIQMYMKITLPYMLFVTGPIC